MQMIVKLVTELQLCFGSFSIYMYRLLQSIYNSHFQSQIQFLILYQSKLLDTSIFKVSHIKFGNSLNFSSTIIIFFKLFFSTIAALFKLFKLSQWQKQQQLMLPPQRLHLLHKIRIILVILCSCILEKIQEQFSLLNH